MKHTGSRTLGGYCGTASLIIDRVLRELNIDKPTVVSGYFHARHNPHVWLTVNDRLLDVTAIQFAASSPIKLAFIEYVPMKSKRAEYWVQRSIINEQDKAVDWSFYVNRNAVYIVKEVIDLLRPEQEEQHGQLALNGHV